MEAELRAARERAALPLETRISSFKEMLAEKDVRTTFRDVIDAHNLMETRIAFLNVLFCF